MSSDARKKFFYKWDAISIMCTRTGILAGYLVGVLLFVLKIFVPIELCLCFGLVMAGGLVYAVY